MGYTEVFVPRSFTGVLLGYTSIHMIIKQNNLQWFVGIQSLRPVRLFATPWTAAFQASLSLTISQSLPKSMSTESMMTSNHLILCCPLLPSIFPSIRVFSNEWAHCIRWPKYWSFSFSISLSNEYSGLMSFRMEWLDLLAVQGTLKSLLQHHSSNTIYHLVFTALCFGLLPDGFLMIAGPIWINIY